MAPLLEVLTRPNVGVMNVAVPGPNTPYDIQFSFDSWHPWKEFNYEILSRMFEHQLNQEYEGSREQTPLEQDLYICNEETLEDLLRRFISPTVNYALDGQLSLCQLVLGTRYLAYYKPDWSVISPSLINQQCYVNILPGAPGRHKAQRKVAA